MEESRSIIAGRQKTIKEMNILTADHSHAGFFVLVNITFKVVLDHAQK